MRIVLRFALLIVCLACSAMAAAQTSAIDVYTESQTLDGRVVAIDVYRPVSGAGNGVAIVAHGFTRGRARHRDLGRALAEAGVTAVVPDLPNVMDHWSNGEAVAELAHHLEQGAFGLEPVERSRLVLVGTSAGGLATVLAAAELPGLAGWVGLDPVDRTGSGIRAASKITSPAVVLLAEPSGCNLFSSGRSIAHAVPGLLRVEMISGASHCDFEAPTTKLCRAMCGESDSQIQPLARDETVRAVLDVLNGPQDAQTRIAPQRAQ